MDTMVAGAGRRTALFLGRLLLAVLAVAAAASTPAQNAQAQNAQAQNAPVPVQNAPLNAPAQNGPAQNGPAQNGPAQSVTVQNGDYVIGPGDVVRITVFQNPDLTTETRVSESGTITFPLIGAVPAAGQSMSALEQAVVEKLRDGGFVKRPQVNVNVLQYKSIQVSVLGQVNRPGRFPLDQAKNRLSEVLAIAGGILPTGADTITLVTRENGKEKKVQIDVPGMLQEGDLAKDIPLQNGDVIYVPRAPLFYIHGEVQKPGQYRIERDMTVIQALATGGGLTLRGTMRGMKLSRRTPAGTVETRDVRPNEHVFPDDVIFVKESLF